MRHIRSLHVIFYGTALAVALGILKWLESRFLVINYSFEMYIGGIALVFTLLGIWIALKISQQGQGQLLSTESLHSEAPVRQEIRNRSLLEAGLSKRELDVLFLMSEGLSNQEIADRLYVSVNTVKSHVSKIFEKLDVKRRTQAVEKARMLGREIKPPGSPA